MSVITAKVFICPICKDIAVSVSDKKTADYECNICDNFFTIDPQTRDLQIVTKNDRMVPL